MKHILLIFALALITMGVGCGGIPPQVPVRPPIALLFTNYKAPLITNCDATDFGTKKGSASTRAFALSYFHFGWGDADVRTAAKDGNITNVKAADYEYVNVLWLWQQFTVIVYGD